MILGVLSFIGGRLWANTSVNCEAFPFRSFAFEKEGKIYKKLGIAKWQSHVPDMSRVFKKIMPPKKIESRPEAEKLRTMIKETCVAEMTHWVLIILGAGYIFIWPGIGGMICFLLSFFVNLVFVIIQRYNRPRLVHVLERKMALKPKEFKERSNAECAF